MGTKATSGLLPLLESEAREGENPFVTFCRVRNREFNASPGILLPEAAASAMADFVNLASQLLLDAKR